MLTQKGQRDKLEKYVNINQEIEVFMNITGGAVYDFSCFGLDAQGMLSDDTYMIFYNQTQSPNKEIRYQAMGSSAQFFVNLQQLPAKIQKLAFTVSIDGAGNMAMISNHVIQIKQNGQILLELDLSGTDFRQETAIISMEMYRKDTWRFCMTASGFNGGLRDLLRYYGGVEVEEPVSVPSETKISLEKKLEQNAPKLVSLAKPLKVELEKRNLLDCVARVALVLDISGSMTPRYNDGTVQEIVNKTLPLAVQFDDDGELDFWYYGSRCKRMPSVTMKNYESAVPEDWKDLMYSLGRNNNEVSVMEDIMREYKGSKLPVYVLFITDGGIYQVDGIKKILKKASKEPVFWQFVGVGGSNYGILENFDTMRGRYVDNANFFALDDFKTVKDSDLYGRLLNEFPIWLRDYRAKSGGRI